MYEGRGREDEREKTFFQASVSSATVESRFVLQDWIHLVSLSALLGQDD